MSDSGRTLTATWHIVKRGRGGVRLLIWNPRMRKKTPARAAAVAAIVHVIHPCCIYSLPAATSALGLKPNTLYRERRLGRLRVTRRGSTYYVLGSWLLEWLRSGEHKSMARTRQAS
jgi:hypothetical protein